MKKKLLFKEFLQYFQIGISNYFNYTPLPVEASLFLTNICNSKCSMCDFWKNSKITNELTTSEVLNVIEQLYKMGVIILSLSAEGEITLRKDLELILKEVSNKFLYSINSNFLSLSNSTIELYRKYSPYQVTVGLDTLRNDKYLKIRGIKNGVDKVLRNIERLQSTDFHNIVIGSIVLHNNLSDILDLIEFVKKNKLAGIRLTAFQDSGFGKDNTFDTINLYREDNFQEKLRTVIDKIIEKKRAGYPILNSVVYLKNIAKSYLSNNFFPVKCRVAQRRIHIFSDGSVSLCQVMGNKSVIGNIRNSTLKECWNSDVATNIRKIVREKKCGGCWLSCYAESNLRFSKEGAVSTLSNSMNRFLKL